jgi:hypothetical protein
VTLAELAATFCADRVAERDALRAMLPCTMDSSPPMRFPLGLEQRCGNAYVPGVEDYDELPVERWCPNCLANRERAAAVRRTRRRRGGLVRAMVAAWEKETRHA